MFFFKKNHFKSIILLLILANCQLQDSKNTHGIIFLENRAKKLIINKSNKNDVIKIVGNPQIKDEMDDNNWIYLERVLSKGKYHELGRHNLKKNNVLMLKFDKYGILKDKEFYKTRLKMIVPKKVLFKIFYKALSKKCIAIET